MAAGKRRAPLVSLLLLVLSVVGFSSCFIGGGSYRRKLSVEWNPGLNSSVLPPHGITLLHVRALGLNDTLHFLLCSQGAPALLLVHTNSTSSSVKVDWPAFLARNTTGSLTVEPESSILYSSALVFTTLWEYDDVNDTADPQNLPPSAFLPPYQLQNFTWSLEDKTLDPTQPTAQLCGGDASPTFINGSFCVQFSAFEVEGRDHLWPSLVHTANCSQIKMWLDGPLPRANYSRFSLELESVGGPSLDRVEVVHSIDDEYTPSIFKASQWVSSPPNRTSEILGYVQWKPVAYRKPNPIFEDATPCRHYSPVLQSKAVPASGLVRAFYGPEPATTRLNISFSMAGEPFYNATNYLSWTVVVGLGNPPVDSFSPLVLSIMAVGLGTPMILIVLGGVYVCLRKRATPPSQSYEPIN
ncbi:glycosylated lysosomal membrane protein [Lampris incognitus]|uniref:glycosylated lysosomal membrane protein n=1 Tax=Lampris incognitus TaxID=2546036 RepID=UPI0024B5B039|nr:glycosylated lysosomal membrane protein [Lampris incognitus]